MPFEEAERRVRRGAAVVGYLDYNYAAKLYPVAPPRGLRVRYSREGPRYCRRRH